MKRLFFSILFLLPVAAFCQRFEVGVSGGVSTNTVPSTLEYGSFDMAFSPSAKIQGLYNKKRLQFGLSVAYNRLRNTSESTYGGETQKVSSYWADPAIGINAVANYKLTGKTSYPYIGVAVGYLMGGEPDVKAIGGSSSGVEFGINAGYVHYLKRFGIFGELSPRMAFMKYSDAGRGMDEKYNIGYFPLTVGVRYKI